MILKIAAGLIMLSVLVVIHEFGHFLFARLFGVGVPIFSVGMGPRLFGITWRGTDYRVAAVPIGGYVLMSGADPFGEEDADTWVPPEQDFMKKPVWQRLIIMAAGPVFNLMLPVVVFTAVLLSGEDHADTIVGSVNAGSPASEAGVLAGDRIVAVAGQPVKVWEEIGEILEQMGGKPVVLRIERDGRELEVTTMSDALTFTSDGYVDLTLFGLDWRGVSARVGIDDPASPAGVAGLLTGDGITEVDGVAVDSWDELLAAMSGEVHEVRYLRAVEDEVLEEAVTLRVDPDWVERAGDPWANRWGIAPVMLFVGAYTEESAADEAGVQLDDRIYALDGQPVLDWADLLRRIRATAPPPTELPVGAGGCMRARPESPDPKTVALTVIRAGEAIDLSFRPKMTREVVRASVNWRPLIGVAQYPNAFIEGDVVHVKYGLGEAVPMAIDDSVEVFRATVSVFGQFVTGERKMKETIGGPIAIFEMAAKSAELGVNFFARMLAGISIGLGLVNLLPVPVLDGGQILFYAIEGIRGRPLSLALRERIQMLGVLFLVALILIVSVNDISRVISGG